MDTPALTRLLVFLDAVLDADILTPIIARAALDERFSVTALMTRRFAAAIKDQTRLLPSNVRTVVLRHRWIRYFRRPPLFKYDALLTTAESSAPAHATAHALTRRASRQGLPTFTIQHGLENVGMTYIDHDHGPDTRIAARRIYLWGPATTLHSAFASKIADRCLMVGCPKPGVTGPSNGIGRNRSTVLVCENLHWSRFGDGFRQRFLADLAEAASRKPDVAFLVKPHPVGRWMINHRDGWPRNVEVIHGAHPLSSLGLPALLAAVDRVVTTPSTVALDAARTGKAVAILGYELDLRLYRPLAIIRSADNWAEFIQMSEAESTRSKLLSHAADFLAQVCAPGDAVGRILDDLYQTSRRDLSLSRDHVSPVAAA